MRYLAHLDTDRIKVSCTHETAYYPTHDKKHASHSKHWCQDLARQFSLRMGEIVTRAAVRSGRPLDLYARCPALMEGAGFVDITVHECKWPVGAWPRDKRLKDAGTVNLEHWATWMEWYGMYLLTKFGEPHPWSREEVQVYIAKLKKELANPHYHSYQGAWVFWSVISCLWLSVLMVLCRKRAWARKPCSTKEATQGTDETMRWTPEVKRESF
jgi:hypothetical protein